MADMICRLRAVLNSGKLNQFEYNAIVEAIEKLRGIE